MNWDTVPLSTLLEGEPLPVGSIEAPPSALSEVAAFDAFPIGSIEVPPSAPLSEVAAFDAFPIGSIEAPPSALSEVAAFDAFPIGSIEAPRCDALPALIEAPFSAFLVDDTALRSASSVEDAALIEAPSSAALSEMAVLPSVPVGSIVAPSVVAAQVNSAGNLRLRMKVWTDLNTQRRYLVAMGFFRDLVRGQPITDVMYAYAMRDDETKIITLTAVEWNALPFSYFWEDGGAGSVGERSVDVIR